MPTRKTRTRSDKISQHDIERLRAAIVDGYPWRIKAEDILIPSPVDTRLGIILGHLSGIFTLSCGFPADPHPSRETVEFLKSELADEIAAAKKKWAHLIPKSERNWRWEDLVERSWTWEGPRELY